MKQSEQINELAKSLVKIQSEIDHATKDKKGYGYSYADLAQIIDIIKEKASKHGVCIMQHIGETTKKVTIDTVITHESGQWMSSRSSVPVAQSKSMNATQAHGSGVTYLRRYALTSIFLIASEDDDGRAERPLITHGSKPSEDRPLVTRVPKPSVDRYEVASEEQSRLINDEEAKLITKLVSETKSDCKNLFEKLNISLFSQMNKKQYDWAMAALMRKKSEGFKEDNLEKVV